MGIFIIKKFHRLRSTRQLMGIEELTDCGVKTARGEFAFFLVRPDNLSVLSPEGITARVRALMELLRGTETVTLRALDSRESYERNKIWYQERLEEETNPAIRELLVRDKEFLDKIQTTTASAREFALVYPVERRGSENIRSWAATRAKFIRDRGFHVRLAGEQDVKRILAVYYQQDVTTEYFESYDGERLVRDCE